MVINKINIVKSKSFSNKDNKEVERVENMFIIKK